MGAGAEGQSGVQPDVDRPRIGDVWPVGQIHSRWPNRIGWKWSIQTRAQSRSSSAVSRHSGRGEACRKRRSWPLTTSISVWASNRPVTRVCAHNGVWPGAGSSTGALPASSSVTASAPACSRASSSCSGAWSMASRVSCSQGAVMGSLMGELSTEGTENLEGVKSASVSEPPRSSRAEPVSGLRATAVPDSECRCRRR